MLFIVPFIIMLPVLLIIWLIGIITMAIPGLRRFHTLWKQIFLSTFSGFVIGLVLSILLPYTIAILGELLSSFQIISKNVFVPIGYFIEIAPLLLPVLGAASGLIYSIKQRKQIVEMKR